MLYIFGLIVNAFVLFVGRRSLRAIVPKEDKLCRVLFVTTVNYYCYWIVVDVMTHLRASCVGKRFRQIAAIVDVKMVDPLLSRRR